MILWDWPRDRPIFYQIWLGVSTWQWGLYNLIFMYVFFAPPDVEAAAQRTCSQVTCVDTTMRSIPGSPVVVKTSSRCSSQFHSILRLLFPNRLYESW